jgi:tetratricopeptide (TPR) repeat protein
MVWFENCRRRGDRTEGARVACDLGDEAAGRGDLVTAREWFGRARSLDSNLETAAERLRALGVSVEPGPGAGAAPANGAAARSDLGRTSAPSGPPRLSVPTAPRSSASGAAAAPSASAPAGPMAESDPDRIEITYGYGVDDNLDLSGLVETFRREVQAQVSGDAQSHYALGVSYLEMGLIDQAIESFRAAAEEPTLKGQASELIGRCHMDHGRFEEAATEFRTALDQPGIAGESALKLRFELGLALEAAGRLDEGLTEFDRVYAAQPNYPDVALKIRSLRRALETD